MSCTLSRPEFIVSTLSYQHQILMLYKIHFQEMSPQFPPHSGVWKSAYLAVILGNQDEIATFFQVVSVERAKDIRIGHLERCHECFFKVPCITIILQHGLEALGYLLQTSK